MDIEELVENFELFDNWEDRYSYIIELGRKMPEMPENLKNDINKVDGCMSNVWINLSLNEEGRIVMHADSNALIVKGLVFIIYITINNKMIEELLNLNIQEIIDRIGLEQHLSPNRRNGFNSMINKIISFIEEGI